MTEPKPDHRRRRKVSRIRETEKIIREAAATGELPLQYMLRIMRDNKQHKDRRDKMAIAAAQYVHPKLAAVEVMTSLTDEQLEEHIAGLASQVGMEISFQKETQPDGSTVYVPAALPAPVPAPTRRAWPKK